MKWENANLKQSTIVRVFGEGSQAGWDEISPIGKTCHISRCQASE